MNNKQLADSLRALADKVEQLPEGMRLRHELKSHGIGTIEHLKAMASLMQKPEADKNNGTHWLKGTFADGIEITAFYPAGLLGKVRKKKVVVCDCEVTTDLSVLTQ